jgi:SAM-dependent methyltransferase
VTAEAHVRETRQGTCFVCGHAGVFELTVRSPREGFTCPRCRSSLRYQHQAQVLVELYGREEVDSFEDLAMLPHFRQLHIYEPGLVGPFRRILAPLPSYLQSYYWPGVPPGEKKEGVRCENLEALTLPPASLDLVITSDIVEHIRRPWRAFEQILTVLRPGGRHVMSIPVDHPMRPRSSPRVDTTTDQDVHLQEPVYHGSPRDPRGSLVYTDFGADVPDRLVDMGYEASVHHGHHRIKTFVMRRPAR